MIEPKFGHYAGDQEQMAANGGEPPLMIAVRDTTSAGGRCEILALTSVRNPHRGCHCMGITGRFIIRWFT